MDSPVSVSSTVSISGVKTYYDFESPTKSISDELKAMRSEKLREPVALRTQKTVSELVKENIEAARIEWNRQSGSVKGTKIDTFA